MHPSHAFRENAYVTRVGNSIGSGGSPAVLLFRWPGKGTSKTVNTRVEALGRGGGVRDGRRPASLPITQ